MKPHRLFSSLGVLSAAALALAPVAASAQPTKVLVLPYAPLYDSIPRATGEQIGKTFENGLRGKSSIELRSLPAESAGSSAKAVSDAQRAAVAEAKAELDRGKSLLQRRRVKPALDAFEAVIRKLQDNAIALENTSALEEAYLRKAAALFLMGREDEAAKGPIAEALVLDPALRLDESDGYGRPFIELVEKVRQEEIAQRGWGELRVDTTPPGALVWVDGREALTSPVRVIGLVPGTHYVTIKLPSQDAYTEVVKIEKDALFRISPDENAPAKEGPVTRFVSHLAQNRMDDSTLAQLGELARMAGAEVVVFGAAFAQGAEMGIVSFVYSPSQNAVSPLQRITLDREMLGATIEINKVSTEFLDRLPSIGEPISLPTPVAAEARPGAEKINEVDMTVDYSAFKDDRPGRTVTPVDTSRHRAGPRRPIGGPRVPIGAPAQPPTGGGARPKLSGAEAGLQDDELARAPEPAPAPAEDFLDFRVEPTEPEPAVQQTPSYTFSGGVSIEDDVPLAEEPQVQKKGGLFSRWWFWTGAAIVVGGAVSAGLAMSGGGDGVTGQVKW